MLTSHGPHPQLRVHLLPAVQRRKHLRFQLVLRRLRGGSTGRQACRTRWIALGHRAVGACVHHECMRVCRPGRQQAQPLLSRLLWVALRRQQHPLPTCISRVTLSALKPSPPTVLPLAAPPAATAVSSYRRGRGAHITVLMTLACLAGGGGWWATRHAEVVGAAVAGSLAKEGCEVAPPRTARGPSSPQITPPA